MPTTKENAHPAPPRTKDACKKELIRAGVSLPTCDLKLADYQQLWRVRVAGEPEDGGLGAQQPTSRARASDVYLGQLDVLEARALALGPAPVPLSVQAALARRPASMQESQVRACAPSAPSPSSARARSPRRAPIPRRSDEPKELSAQRVGLVTPTSARHFAQPRLGSPSWQEQPAVRVEQEPALSPAPSPGALPPAPRPHWARHLLPALALCALCAFSVGVASWGGEGSALSPLGQPLQARGPAPPSAGQSEAVPPQEPFAAGHALAAKQGHAPGIELAASPTTETAGGGSLAGGAAAAPEPEPEPARPAARDAVPQAAAQASPAPQARAAPEPAADQAARGGEEVGTESVSLPDKLLLLGAVLLWRILAATAAVGGALLRAALGVCVRACGALLALAWRSPLLVAFSAALVLGTHGIRCLARRWSGRAERQFVASTSLR